MLDDDLMDGGADNDRITGEVGSDTLNGGSGSDSFVIIRRKFSRRTTSIDTIRDVSEGGGSDQESLRSESLMATQLALQDRDCGVLICVNVAPGNIVIDSFTIAQLWDQIVFI
jgi:Ca2+-binding RTX toxin-like protein